MSWSEKISGPVAVQPTNYCGTTVTPMFNLDWQESVSVDPFTFPLDGNFDTASSSTPTSGSVTFTATSELPTTINGAQTCPSDVSTWTGSFSGSGNTIVSADAENGGPYIQLIANPAGGGTAPGQGWPGTLTHTDQAINGGTPDVYTDQVWLPHIALDVEIGSDDTGVWSGQMPGTNFFQKNNNSSDRIGDSSSYDVIYYGTPSVYGLFGSANASLSGPSTSTTPPPGGGTPPPGGGKTPPAAKPPVTKITHHPKAKTTATKATFKFSSNEAKSTFTCALDKAKAKPCTSPKTYKHLAKGKHTLHVDAINSAKTKDATPAKWTWKVVKKK